MGKKKAIKILGASAIAASAFVATAPLQASANVNVDTLVQDAKSKGTVLKWAISVEGSADGTTRPWAQYNAAKDARDKAVAAVNKLPAAQKNAYLADIETNVNLHITRAMHYIDAITAGEKIKAKKEVLESQIAKNEINDATEKAYHELSTEIRKQAVLLDRVYGQSTRNAIRDQYKIAAEDVRDSVKFAVTVKIELDLAKKALEANDDAKAEKHLAEAAKYLADVEIAAMKATLTSAHDALEAEVTPKVKEVKAINGMQMVVVFNKEVKETEVTSPKFALEGYNAPTVELAKDNKTATLTFDQVIDVTNAVFTVEPVATKADEKVKTERHVSTITYKDTVAPSITDVTYSYAAGKATATIALGEALTTGGTVSVNGSVVAPTTDLAKGTIAIGNLDAGKTYTIDIVGATDQAGNIANPIRHTITVPTEVVDTVKPVASISASGNKVTLNFSKEVQDLGTVTINGTSVDASEFVQDATTKTKYVLDVQAATTLLDAVSFLNATIVVDGYEDNAGNKGEKVEFSTTLQADTTAPAFVSAAVSRDQKTLLLTFNDEIHEGTLGDLVLKVKDGVHVTDALTLTGTNTEFGFDVDGNGKVEGTEKNVLAIAYDFDEKSSYSFELDGNIVEDQYGNKLASKLTFAVSTPELPTTPAQPEAIVELSTLAVSGSKATVVFNNDMSDTALVAANYKIGGKTLPANTELRFVGDRKTVEITLPEGFITANGTYVLEATNLLDVNRNTLKGGKVTASATFTENVVPFATSINVLSSKSFTVNFSEAVQDLVTVEGVTVTINNTKVDATLALANNVLTVTTASDFAQNAAITVEFKDSNIVDANNNKLKNGVVTK